MSEGWQLRVGDRVIMATPGSAQLVDDAVPALLSRPSLPAGAVCRGTVDTSRWDAAKRARAGLVVLGDVTVTADVSILDHLVAIDRGRAAEVLADAPLLAGRGGDPAGWLSGGERQVLGWLQTILVVDRVPGDRDRAVVLDVAGRGLDQPTLRWAGEVVAGWVAGGVGVLVHAGRPEEELWIPLAR